MRIDEATNKKQLLAALEAEKNRRIEIRRGYETLWWNNIALVAGDHYVQWNPQQAAFVEERNPDRKQRIVLNHALTVARTELAKMTKSHPVMTVMANSDEQTDLAAAKVGSQVLDALEWKFSLRKLRKDALWWMILGGNAGVEVCFDYTDDKSGYLEATVDPETQEYTFNDDRKAQLEQMVKDGDLTDLQTDKHPLGDLLYKVYSPFQLLPDRNARSWGELKDIITIEAVDIGVIKGMYPKAARDLRPDVGGGGPIQQRMLQRAGAPGMYGSPELEADNATFIYTYWLLPNIYRHNSLLKNGMMYRWAANTELECSESGFPYSDRRLPFAFLSHIPSTTIWADSVIQHIREANLEIDKTVSQLIETKDYMSNPMWRIAQQHRIKGDVRNLPGAMVKYTHVPNVPPPEPIMGMQMPQQVENLVAGLRDQILDISGQSEVARGRMPTGVRSGVQVAYMQEEDDTKLAPTVENFEDAVAMMSSLSLSRVGQFFTTERLLRYYRRDGVFDVVKFKGADLKGTTDVVPQAMSAMPKSKAARQQYVLELATMGLIRDPKKIMEMLDLGQGEPDDQDKSIAQANRENNIMLYGLDRHMFKLDKDADESKVQQTVAAAIPVKKWHNHQLHLQRHYSQMMDEEFDTLIVKHPEIVRLFDEHTAMHEAMLQQQMQEQMAAQEAAKGAPEAAGGATPNPAGNNGQSSNMVQSTTPDATGGGLDLSSRQIVPQPGGP